MRSPDLGRRCRDDQGTTVQKSGAKSRRCPQPFTGTHSTLGCSEEETKSDEADEGFSRPASGAEEKSREIEGPAKINRVSCALFYRGQRSQDVVPPVD